MKKSIALNAIGKALGAARKAPDSHSKKLVLDTLDVLHALIITAGDPVEGNVEEDVRKFIPEFLKHAENAAFLGRYEGESLIGDYPNPAKPCYRKWPSSPYINTADEDSAFIDRLEFADGKDA